MDLPERERHEVFVRVEQLFGPQADAFMTMLVPEMPRKMDQLRSELRDEMAGLRGEMAELCGEMAGLRGELRSQLPKLYVANVGAMVGVAGLVLAAGALL